MTDDKRVLNVASSLSSRGWYSVVNCRKIQMLVRCQKQAEDSRLANFVRPEFYARWCDVSRGTDTQKLSYSKI